MLRTLFALILLATPLAANAGSVFLNGVNIDGVKNQTFANCKVEIDAFGNIRISAKGYAVGGDAKTQAAAAQGPAVAPGGVPTRHYFLVTEKAAPGMSQYDVDLFINSKWVKKFLDSEGHVVMDITKHLVTGPNKIVFIAKKNMGSGRRSSSPNHYFRIVMGEGNAGGRNIMISKKLIDYKRTALETRAFQDKYELIAH